MDTIFKVVQVISNMKAVINAGTNFGITDDMRFLVYSIGEELTDPDSGESLGRLEIVKGIGEVEHIQEKITTIVSDSYDEKKIKKNMTPLGLFYNNAIEEIQYQQKPFRNINVGDLVKIIE